MIIRKLTTSACFILVNFENFLMPLWNFVCHFHSIEIIICTLLNPRPVEKWQVVFLGNAPWKLIKRKPQQLGLVKTCRGSSYALPHMVNYWNRKMSSSSTGRHQLLTPTERDVPPTMKQEAQLPSLPRRRKEDFLLAQ